MRKVREFSPNVLGPLALALLVVLFYWKVIFGHSIFVFVDASRFFYPLWKWGGEALKQGWIPLWNPDAQFGTPYFADPQMAYAYPPVPIFYLLFPPLAAFAALTILHHFWALLGFWVFARHQGFSARASFLGSFVFGFSLHVVCSSWTPVALMTISWIPWIFFTVEKVCRGEKSGFLFLSIAWAMQLAAGYPVLTYLTTLAVGMHLLWRITTNPPQPPFFKVGSNRNRNKPPLKKGGWGGFSHVVLLEKVFAAGFIAIFYNLVWGLSFAELFKLSNYENGASRFQDLGWLDFATLLSPFDQGHPLMSGYHGPHYWVSTYFVGLPTLCLLIWGALRLAYRKTPWGLLPLLLVLSLGVLGLSTLLRSFFPGYSLVIHSGYWLALVIFWMAWMSMEPLRDFTVKNPDAKNTLLWAGIVVGVFFASFLTSYFTHAPMPFAAFIGSLALAVLASAVRHPGLRWGALALAVVFSLGSAASSLNILLDRSYYEIPPSTLALLTKPGRIFFTPPLLQEAVILQGDTMEQAYEAAKEKMYPNWPLAFGREEAPMYNTLQLKNSFEWTFNAFRYSLGHSREVLDYLGIRYVFGRNEFEDFTKVNSGGTLVEITENTTPMPRWFSVKKAVPEGPALDADFARAARNHMDYSEACFVEDASLQGRYERRSVKSQGSSPNQLRITAEGKGKALIVSSETVYPGWRADVNGKDRAVETVNHSFRGVVLNDGETQATFTFEPLSFRLGLFCALVVCGLWVFMVLQGTWNPREING